MNAREILDKFYLWANDQDLGDLDALDLANEEYRDILEEREWEFLKKTTSGLVTSITVPYIDLPADFGRLISKDSSKQNRVIRVGSTYQQYREVAYDTIRNNRTNTQGWYIDDSANRLYFTTQPASVQSVEFDYLYTPADLVLTPSPTSPVFPMEGAHKAIPLRMAGNFTMMEGAEKGRSYQDEMLAEADKRLSRMRRADALRKTVN